MVLKPQTLKLNQIAHHVFPFVLLVVGLSVIVGMIAITGSPKKVYQQNTQTPIPTPQPVPHTTFTSDKLGISFTYINTVGGKQNFFTKEIGDTVYLYYNLATNQPFSGTDAEFLNTIPGHGYSVEVFTKDPQQSLQGAIKQQFLTGYAESDCIIRATHYGHPRQEESFQTAVIDFPRKSTYTREQLDAAVAKCPKYTTAFGVSYFMTDPQHPNKLLFIKLGQDNIPSGVNGLTWDGTIKVLN
jgi:hypothetical protein